MVCLEGLGGISGIVKTGVLGRGTLRLDRASRGCKLGGWDGRERQKSVVTWLDLAVWGGRRRN
jgi:hypothetical protein